MFTDSSVFILAQDKRIFRLEVDRSTQVEICRTFASSVEQMTKDKNCRDFTGNYKPEDDEYLKIENFQLPDDIKDAIRNPMGVAAFDKDPDVRSEGEFDFLGYPEIKAVFVGERTEEDGAERFAIAFQRYRREQNLIALPFRLFYSNNTFKQEKHFGIGITDNIDCYYVGDEIQFCSFYYARQIFDLSGYYRSATDTEVVSFIRNEHLDFEDAEGFNGLANTYVRRKIALINDSSVLEEYTAMQIKSLANTVGIDIKVKNKKVVIPADKDDALTVVAFLDEEAYRGPFSKNLLLANSKRVLKKS